MALSSILPLEQKTLDALSVREFRTGAGAKLDDLILQVPASEERALREVFAKLAEANCVTVEGFEGSQVVEVTRHGILASENFDEWDRVGQQLLSYLGERLQREGSEFEYTWSELKAWGALAHEYAAYFRVIESFHLSGGGSSTRTAKEPGFSYRLPSFKVKLRGIRDLTALNALLDQRAQVAEAERQTHRLPRKEQSPVEKTSKSSKAYGGRWETLETVGEGGQAHVFKVKDLHAPDATQLLIGFSPHWLP